MKIEIDRRSDRYRIKFVVVSEKPLTWDEAAEIQQSKGYHPAGYGISKPQYSKKEDGSYETTWSCSHSSD